jgi:crossover junction endodeoxyribonuclease RuvC
MGIDPGYATLGYGVISLRDQKFHAEHYGAIITKSGEIFSKRISYIYDKLLEIFHLYPIETVALERLYFQNNQKTAMCVAQARGVILLAAHKANVSVYEYTPLQVKMAVTGYGQAPKLQIMEMTRRLLKLEKVPKPDDTADALAIAICHAHSVGIISRLKKFTT